MPAADWEAWWRHVAEGFRPVRDRADRQVKAAEVQELVRMLAEQKVPAHAAPRVGRLFTVRDFAEPAEDQLNALGPNAIPHLLKAVRAADEELQHHLAEVIDELGGARQLPRDVRLAYFIERLAGLDPNLSVQGQWVALRALQHQDFRRRLTVCRQHHDMGLVQKRGPAAEHPSSAQYGDDDLPIAGADIHGPLQNHLAFGDNVQMLPEISLLINGFTGVVRFDPANFGDTFYFTMRQSLKQFTACQGLFNFGGSHR